MAVAWRQSPWVGSFGGTFIVLQRGGLGSVVLDEPLELDTDRVEVNVCGGCSAVSVFVLMLMGVIAFKCCAIERDSENDKPMRVPALNVRKVGQERESIRCRRVGLRRSLNARVLPGRFRASTMPKVLITSFDCTTPGMRVPLGLRSRDPN
jgi:hypothetical protein